MPTKTPRDSAEEAHHRVAAYVQKRLREEGAKSGWGFVAKVGRATGFTPAHVSGAKNHASVGHGFAEAVARYWGMTYDEMKRVAAGQAEAPAVGEPEPTPPPAKSDVREKAAADHWFPDEVESLFIAAVRRRAEVDYTVPVSRVAKVFVRDATHQLRPGVTRLDLMLTALDTARDIEASGAEPTPEAVWGALLSKAVEQAAPRTGETALERCLREADENNRRRGIEGDPPGWLPKVPANDPPGVPPGTPRFQLPPVAPPVSAPPPPASGQGQARRAVWERVREDS